MRDAAVVLFIVAVVFSGAPPIAVGVALVIAAAVWLVK